MVTKEMIDRINELSRKSKTEGLTDAEKVEQQQLRRVYIDYIKGQVKVQLDSIEYVEDQCDCGGKCGHDHKHHHHHHKKHSH